MNHQPAGLVIEDDINLAEIFSQALSMAGYTPKIIHNGQKALEHLENEIPHLIILDLNLPEVNGEAILSHLQQDDRFEETVVIVATANGTWGDMLHERANLVLEKPISFMQLTNICQRFLAQIEAKN